MQLNMNTFHVSMKVFHISIKNNSLMLTTRKAKRLTISSVIDSLLILKVMNDLQLINRVKQLNMVSWLFPALVVFVAVVLLLLLVHCLQYCYW